MDRLTFEESYCSFTECDLKDRCGIERACYDKRLYDKLKEYEDLEEQGLLVKLPIQLGKPVYILEDDWQPDESCPENEWMFKCVKYALPLPFELWMVDEWGKSVFPTEEEAEKKLVEMGKQDG